MRLLLLAFGLFGSLIVAVPSFAETSIAVVDMIEVLNESNAQKRNDIALAKKRDDFQEKINKMEAPLLEKKRRLEERRSMMTDEQFIEEQSQLRAEVREVRAEVQTLQESLQREVLRRRKEILGAVNSVVDSLAKAKGYDLVLDKNSIRFASDKTNISKEVLKRVNKRLDK